MHGHSAGVGEKAASIFTHIHIHHKKHNEPCMHAYTHALSIHTQSDIQGKEIEKENHELHWK